jgi:hypothetical protein
MKLENIVYVLGGLIVGFIIGMLLATDSDDTDAIRTVVQEVVSEEVETLRADIADIGAQSANLRPAMIPEYFLVSFEELESWLGSVDEELLDDTVVADIQNVIGLGTAENFGQYFIDQEDSVNNVLSVVHQALMEEAGNDEGSLFTVCVGVDDDPYNPLGQGLYLYVELPAETSEIIPKEWEYLEEPKENDMLWSSVCHTEPLEIIE